MERKKWYHWVLYPPIPCLLLLIAASAVLLVLVFVKGLDTHPIAYAVYMVAFYSASVTVLFFVKVFPGLYRKAKEKIERHPLAKRYTADAFFRTHVKLYLSLTINSLYGIMNLAFGIWYRTSWFVIYAVYYIVMALMRFLLARFVTQNAVGQQLVGEYRRSRLCAVLLLTINLALSGAILMMIYFDRGFEYQGMLIYIMAMYAFYAVSVAIVNMVKFRRYQSPIMSTAKLIDLAAALMTMLALETAMLSQFGAEMQPENKRLFIIATGAGISVIILVFSLYTIVHNSKKLKELAPKSKE